MFTEDDSLARSDASATILVIDDNMTNLAVVTTYLFEHGHNILVAQDGQSGLEKSALAHPNLILLDVDLPDMDGFEVCRRLKATELTSSIPVIFITAHATQTNYKVRGFAVGGVDYVEKPIQQQELLARINTHLRIQSLTQNLQRHTIELQKYQTQLEAMVAQRTDELAQTVARLEEEIAERKQAEEALRQKENQLSVIFNNNHDLQLFVAVEPDGAFRVAAVNQHYIDTTRSFGYDFTAQFLVGKTVEHMLHDVMGIQGELLDLTLRRYRQPVMTGLPIHYEEDLETSAGHYFAEVTIVPVFDDNGVCSHLLWTSHNITERKRAEEQLRRSEERYRTLAQNLPDSALLLYDYDLRFILVDGPELEATGFSREMLEGRTLHEVLPPEFTQIVEPNMRRALAGEVFHAELPFDDRIYRYSYVPLRDGSGAVPMAMILANNITERKQAEMRLKHSETSLNEAQQLAHLGSWEWDILTDENIWSAEQYRIFGYVPEAVEPDYALFVNALHPADKDRVLAAVQNTAKTGVPYEDEYRIIRPDKAERVLYTKATLQGDAQGRACRVIGVTWDITERKKMEELLAQRAAQLEKVAHISSAISAVLDVNMLLPKVVDLVKEQFGYSHSHIYLLDNSSNTLMLAAGAGEAGRQMLAKGHHIQLAHPHSIVARVAREKQGLIINDVKHTTNFWPNPLLPETRSDLAVPLIIGDEVIGVFDVQSNETEHFTAEDTYIQTTLAGQVAISIENARQFAARKQTEDRLVTYTAKLEASNRDLQEFAYVAAHDLQEPLRKVLAFGDRLAIKYNDALGETGVDYLRRMQDASRRMQTLINDLLSFSRVSTRAQPFQDVDLAEIARDVLSDLESRIEQKEASVTIEEMARIQADPTQIRQLLQNLVGNALKFSHVERPLQIKISAKIAGGTCQICVEDNGIGFDTKYLDRIFKPFQRLHDRSEYEGSGMGLAICRRIVERHSGSITATSEIDKGATFIVSLPVRQMEGIKP